MNKKLWLSVYRIAGNLAEKAGLDKDARSEIAIGVMETLSLPGADPLAQGVWGRKLNEITVASRSFRGALRHQHRQDNIGPAKIGAFNTLADDDGNEMSAEMFLPAPAHASTIDRRVLELELSQLAPTQSVLVRAQALRRIAGDNSLVKGSARSVFNGKGKWYRALAWDHRALRQMSDILSILSLMGREDIVPDEVHEDEPAFELTRDKSREERIAEAYLSSSNPELGVEAIRASRSANEFRGVTTEATDSDHLTELLMSDDQTARDKRNGGRQAAVYLEPEHELDGNVIETALDEIAHPNAHQKVLDAAKAGQAELIKAIRSARVDIGFTWLVEQFGAPLFDSGMDRVTDLARGMTPTEKASFATAVANQIARVGELDDITKQDILTSLVDRMVVSGQYTTVVTEEPSWHFFNGMPMPSFLFGSTTRVGKIALDLNDEDVQFCLGEGGLNLDNLPFPVDREMPPLNQAIGIFVGLIKDAVPPGDEAWKPWHIKECRQEEARVALMSPCGWKTASQAGMRAAKASGRLKRIAAQQRTSVRPVAHELTVRSLTRRGVGDGSGLFATWADLVNGKYDVYFESGDAAQRFFTAVKSVPAAAQAVARLQGG